MMGMTGFQLEIPRSLRAMIGRDEKLRTDFAQIIVELYEEVIVPGWKARHNQLPIMQIDPSLAEKVVDQDPNIEELLPAYSLWDDTAGLRGKTKLLI